MACETCARVVSAEWEVRPLQRRKRLDATDGADRQARPRRTERAAPTPRTTPTRHGWGEQDAHVRAGCGAAGRPHYLPRPPQQPRTSTRDERPNPPRLREHVRGRAGRDGGPSTSRRSGHRFLPGPQPPTPRQTRPDKPAARLASELKDLRLGQCSGMTLNADQESGRKTCDDSGALRRITREQ